MLRNKIASFKFRMDFRAKVQQCPRDYIYIMKEEIERELLKRKRNQ